MDIREQVKSLLSEDCKEKINQFDDLELHRIYDYTMENKGRKIINVYRSPDSHSVIGIEIQKDKGKDSCSLII